MAPSGTKAVIFDVFGTVVDWRSSVIQAGEALARARGVDVDWPSFADEWRDDGYKRGMERVRSGELPWMNADGLHRRKLDELLVKFGITGLSEAEIEDFNRVWHRLEPWPDAVIGLARLRRRYIISPLSNGNFSLLTNLAKRRGLPWDCIISTELVQAFKPDREAYLLAPKLLDLQPGEVIHTAAHLADLRGAQAAGLRTAFVPRPLEYGPNGHQEQALDPSFDVVATDFMDLARQLGA